MKIQFIGATHEVTGSCTLLEVGGRYYLVDCGMEQGTDVFQNIPLPVLPSQIEAVFLTHAHIDHSGMLPKLCKDGFKGRIYATEATCNLCDIMLRDSAHIQESEAQWRSRKAERAGEPVVEPTYTLQDVEEIEAIGTETARFVGALIRRFLWRCDYLWKPGFDLPPYTVEPGTSCCIHDWAAVAPAIDPLTATDIRKELCRVDCSGGMADGQMVIDRRGYYLEPNASIVYDMDEKRCKELLKSLLAKK